VFNYTNVYNNIYDDGIINAWGIGRYLRGEGWRWEEKLESNENMFTRDSSSQKVYCRFVSVLLKIY